MNAHDLNQSEHVNTLSDHDVEQDVSIEGPEPLKPSTMEPKNQTSLLEGGVDITSHESFEEFELRRIGMEWLREEKVDLSSIVLPGSRRLEEKRVKDLTVSLNEIGLIQPIILDEQMNLICGLHRYTAATELKWQTIQARIVKCSQERAELIEIDENLIRKELTALERGEYVARRKEVYEQIHPAAKRGAGPGKKGGGKAASQGIPPSFLDDTAMRTGRGRSTIHEEVQIGKMPEQIRQRIHGTALANDKGKLLEIAREKDETLQKEILDGYLSPEEIRVPGDSGPEKKRKEVKGNPRETKGKERSGDHNDRKDSPVDDAGVLDGSSPGDESTSKALPESQVVGQDFTPSVPPSAADYISEAMELLDRMKTLIKQSKKASSSTEENAVLFEAALEQIDSLSGTLSDLRENADA